jgi:intracellular septation protein
MQQVIEYVPWVVFGLAYKFGGGLYPATAALMASMALLLLYDWVTLRKVPQMHLILALLVWVFGAATLILQDVRFLQWKASLFYWVTGLALAGSAFIGKQTLLERLLGKSLPEGVTLPASDWRASSLFMGVFYLLLGSGIAAGHARDPRRQRTTCRTCRGSRGRPLSRHDCGHRLRGGPAGAKTSDGLCCRR